MVDIIRITNTREAVEAVHNLSHGISGADWTNCTALKLDGLDALDPKIVDMMCIWIKRSFASLNKSFESMNRHFGLPVTPPSDKAQMLMQFAAALREPELLDGKPELASIPAHEVEAWKTLAMHGTDCLRLATAFTQLFQYADQDKIMWHLRHNQLQPVGA